MAAYTAFSEELVDSLDAQTPIERQFAQTVADNQWRINRIRSIEDCMLCMNQFDKSEDPEIHTAMNAAIRLAKTREMQRLPYDPKEDGFVYASAEIALERRRRDRLQDSLLAEKARFVLTTYAAFRQKEAA